MLKLKIDIEKKLIITVGFFATAVIVVTFFIVWPTISQIYRINADTQNLKEYLEKKHESIMGLKNAKIKIGEIKEEVAGFSTYFYQENQQLKLITDLENNAGVNNIEQKINSYETKEGKALLSINLAGNYENILNYLSDLENMDLFINIDALHLSAGNYKEPEKYNLRLELSLYVNN